MPMTLEQQLEEAKNAERHWRTLYYAMKDMRDMFEKEVQELKEKELLKVNIAPGQKITIRRFVPLARYELMSQA